MKKLLLGCLPVAGLLIVGITQYSAYSQYGGGSGGGGSPGAAAGSAVSVGTAQGGQGEYLVDSQGFSLYEFDADSPGHPTCDGQCAQTWPPLLVPSGQSPVATGDAQSSMLGTAQRSDGSTQVTYNGMPLYRYAPDTSRGDTYGQGIMSFGAKWYLVRPDGTKLLPTSYQAGAAPYGGIVVLGTSCDSFGRCCDIYGHCVNNVFVCDRNKHCCDRFGHCFDFDLDCDLKGHCCDSRGHCFDEGPKPHPSPSPSVSPHPSPSVSPHPSPSAVASSSPKPAPSGAPGSAPSSMPSAAPEASPIPFPSISIPEFPFPFVRGGD